MPNRQMRTATVVVAWLIATACVALAASVFEGTWNVQDTGGKTFQIVLSSDGVAKASRGDGMAGTWKEEGGTAVITWDTGWVTKIVKGAGGYEKMAYRKGQALDSAPVNRSGAEKVN